MLRCAHWACSARGAMFEDVTLTDIRGGGRAPSFLWGCVFSRVTLRGWISGILFRQYVDPQDETANRVFSAANAENSLGMGRIRPAYGPMPGSNIGRTSVSPSNWGQCLRCSSMNS